MLLHFRWRHTNRLAGAPGVRAASLTGVAQMMFVARHAVGATAVVAARDFCGMRE